MEPGGLADGRADLEFLLGQRCLPSYDGNDNRQKTPPSVSKLQSHCSRSSCSCCAKFPNKNEGCPIYIGDPTILGRYIPIYIYVTIYIYVHIWSLCFVEKL